MGLYKIVICKVMWVFCHVKSSTNEAVATMSHNSFRETISVQNVFLKRCYSY